MTTVINRRTQPHLEQVYIGRGSKWGNPFVIGPSCTRDQAVAQYEQHLWNQIKAGEVTVADLLELDGKALGCYCAPYACHGDVLVRAVSWAKQQ